MQRLAVATLLAMLALPTLAQIPAAPNCAVDEPPSDAGAFATPGGFLLVHPRNADLSDSYTGCKVVWVVAAPDRFHRLATLYFERGELRIAQAYDGRGGKQPRATCTLPGTAPGCGGLEGNPLAALKLPTWPRKCMAPTDAPECAKEPE